MNASIRREVAKPADVRVVQAEMRWCKNYQRLRRSGQIYSKGSRARTAAFRCASRPVLTRKGLLRAMDVAGFTLPNEHEPGNRRTYAAVFPSDVSLSRAESASTS